MERSKVIIDSLSSLESQSSGEWLLTGHGPQSSELQIQLGPSAMHVLCLLLAAAIEKNGGELLGEEPTADFSRRN